MHQVADLDDRQVRRDRAFPALGHAQSGQLGEQGLEVAADVPDDRQSASVRETLRDPDPAHGCGLFQSSGAS